jgi:Protein of unknown function (DUF2480)
MTEPIINKVASSSLITLNLEDYYDDGERVVYDLRQNLFQDLILKEKDFRAFVKAHDWQQYKGKNVAITCTADAVIPTWAFMLLATAITPYANLVVFGDLEDLERSLFQHALTKIDLAEFKDQRLVIKGCSKVAVPVAAYVEMVRLLQPIAKSIMYGEPCSTVPIYKVNK